MIGDTVFISDDGENVAYRETRYKDYVFERDKAEGLVFDTGNSSFKTSFKVDSFLAMRSFKTLSYFTGNDVLIAKKTIRKDSIIEAYIPKLKPDNSYPDTTYLCYSKTYDDVPGIFAVLKTPPASKMVLREILSVYNPTIIGSGVAAITLPRRVIFFRITRTGLQERDEIEHIFKRYSRQHSCLK